MPIPDFQSTMLPLLQLLAEEPQKAYPMTEVFEKLIEHFQLTEDEVNELLPSGTQRIIYNRIGWARTYLKKAELLHDPKRKHTQITDLGIKFLAENPDAISIKVLSERFESFRKWQIESKTKSTYIEEDAHTEEAEAVTQEVLAYDENLTIETPEEILETNFKKLNHSLADEILETILSKKPRFFEQLVVDLITKMGYGGFRKDAAEVTQASRDGGIDGVIKEDKLGLSHIYIQAKRYTDSAVGSPDLQKFVGALMVKGSKKGIFITTSRFTKEALTFANSITASNTNIVLVDGKHLAKLMIEYNLGVSTQTTYEVKRIDSDYFDPA